jgi:DNA polymerase-3 subunit gamma/tau
MEDFVVSARKYRPKTFGTVVGQEKITQTLLRAIENNHLAQAFLFCGPRGVGKTTCARILARTVNQYSQPDSDAENDFSFNIFELDAASNNSVDDIRSLIDQVRIPPQIGKYKIYIIDEVHMLSTNAFNAFLKTLEEPPPYAIFILATTEKHKVLPTIISRCQIFDFNRIQIPEMVSHLRGIAQKENISVESDALHIIAEKADGALRDALSIFDQMVSFSGNSVTYQNVIDHLNILDYDHYFSLTDAFLQGNRTEVLLTFNTILNNGFDGHNFVNGLASHLRNLLFCVSPETAALLEVGDNIRDKYLEQSKACETRFLLNSRAKRTSTTKPVEIRACW